MSPIYEWIHRLPDGMFVVGDSGFGITPKLITTYTDTHMRTQRQRKESLNYQISRVRVRIEQVFGVIKRIFPYLGYARRFDQFEKHIEIVECLFVLYNLMIDIGSINTTNLVNTVTTYAVDDFVENAISDMNEAHNHFKNSRSYYNIINESDLEIREQGKKERSR